MRWRQIHIEMKINERDIKYDNRAKEELIFTVKSLERISVEGDDGLL